MANKNQNNNKPNNKSNNNRDNKKVNLESLAEEYATLYSRYLDTQYIENPKFNKTALQNLLQSGIGFGYCIVHKKGGKIHTKKIV